MEQQSCTAVTGKFLPVLNNFRISRSCQLHEKVAARPNPDDLTRQHFDAWRAPVRVWTTALFFCLSLALAACGSGKSTPAVAAGDSLSGNWLITLSRHADPQPLIYSGFLLQAGNSVTGSLKLGGGCSGVGPVTGTLDGQNLQLDVNEFGQNLTLTGIFPPSGSDALVGGPFSTIGGGCTGTSTGTWAGLRVPPMTGPFHGTLASDSGNGTVNVSGTFTQGPNIGATNADVTGQIDTTGPPPFCSYLTTATMTGTITGTSVSLFFFGPDGSALNLTPVVATLAPDGSSLNATQYTFQGTSKTCTGDIGSIQLSLP